MDIDVFYKTVMLGTKVFKSLLLIPFLVLFGFLSRVSWDYLRTGKTPPKKKVGALFVLSVFSSVVFILGMRAYGIERENIELGVPFVAFLGHNIWTFLMENKDEIFHKIIDLVTFKKKKKK